MSECDDWARKCEKQFSLIVSKTIACVDKMRVNILCLLENTMLTKCLYISKSIRDFVRICCTKHQNKTVSIFCRCNYLGFHITYEKSPIMRVCVVACTRCERNIPSRWHIQLNSSQLRHNTKIVNKLNEFKDVARLAAYVSIAWVLANLVSKRFLFGCDTLLSYVRWTLSGEHAPVY